MMASRRVAFLLAALAVGAGADERRGTVYLRAGEPPLVVLKPPIERWVFEPAPDATDPRLFLAVVDLDFGTRIEFREFAGGGPEVAEEIARRFAADLAEPVDPVRAERPFGSGGGPVPVWTFEGRPRVAADPAIGVVAHEVWSLEAPGRVYVVSIRTPEIARQGRPGEWTRAALDYVRGSIVLEGRSSR